MTMRDYDNAVAVWNEFNELPPGIEAFRQFVVSNTEGPLVVVGDNRGLLSAGLGVDRDVIMMRHRDELRASDVATYNAMLRDYSRGADRAKMFVPDSPTAKGKYTWFASHMENDDFLELLTPDATLVANGVLFRWYEQPVSLSTVPQVGTWLERVNETGLTKIIVRNAGQGLLSTAQREATFLNKRGWPTVDGEEPFLVVSRKRG